ncbi:hypothetical protein [uncultured Catenibacterium sp.]|uniref:hypothetical protein n=1 Tax=uncultured Catenibacterium sp. TaxID=286142 RepID=UPI0025F67EAF|nr:hypothetical protein [uncultured Catenibacterium sp.]
MLNAERFKKQILDVVEDDKKYNFAIKDDDPNAFSNCHSDISCKNCIFTSLKNGKNCLYNRFNWLLSEYKEPVKLIRVEHEILRYLYKRDYRYIAREESERVIAFKGRPHKITCGTWNTISDEKIGFLNLYDFSNLFQFTDWKDLESTSIEDVLKNCEVIDDDL